MKSSRALSLIHILNTYRPNKFDRLSTPLAFWGWAWWVGAGLTAIDEFIPNNTFAHAGLIFVTLTSLLLPVVAKKINWQRLSSLTALLLPAMTIAVLWEVVNSLFISHYSIFEYNGYIAWPFAFATYAWLISRDAVPNKAWLRAPLLWLIAAIGVLEWQHRLWTYAVSYTHLDVYKRQMLDEGVRVVMAHCASDGHDKDFDNGDKLLTSFELFARMMDTPAYEKLLFGDISATTLFNHSWVLKHLLQPTDWHHRLHLSLIHI